MSDKIKILAIESSCDETAAAVVENGRCVRSNIISSQIELHKLYGGVVPEIAGTGLVSVQYVNLMPGLGSPRIILLVNTRPSSLSTVSPFWSLFQYFIGISFSFALTGSNFPALGIITLYP